MKYLIPFHMFGHWAIDVKKKSINPTSTGYVKMLWHCSTGVGAGELTPQINYQYLKTQPLVSTIKSFPNSLYATTKAPQTSLLPTPVLLIWRSTCFYPEGVRLCNSFSSIRLSQALLFSLHWRHSSAFEQVLVILWSAALDLGAGVEQPFDYPFNQNRQAMHSTGRWMDCMGKDNMVNGLFLCATLTKQQKETPHLCSQERKLPTRSEAN